LADRLAKEMFRGDKAEVLAYLKQSIWRREDASHLEAVLANK